MGFTIKAERTGLSIFNLASSAQEALRVAEARRLSGAEKVEVFGPDSAFINAQDLAKAAKPSGLDHRGSSLGNEGVVTTQPVRETGIQKTVRVRVFKARSK